MFGYKIPLVVFLMIPQLVLAVEQPQRGIKVVAGLNADGSVAGLLGDTQVALGNYHALLIGINEYQNTEFAPKLRTPVNDVYNLRSVLVESYGFQSQNVRLITDSEGTRAGILSAIASYRDAPLRSFDNLLIYYAGHGFQDPGTEDGFWIPVDGTSDESSWISVSEIKRIVKKIRTKHLLLISDSCFSGSLTRAALNLPINDRFLAEVARKDSYQVITSGGLEPVADGGREGMSLFAYMLNSYLKDQPNPYFTADRLFTDLAPLVANASNSEQTPEHGKIPGSFDQNGQFVFARVTGGAIDSSASSASTVGSSSPRVSGLSVGAEPGVTYFSSISFAHPSGFDLVENRPGEKLKFKKASIGTTIFINVVEMSALDMTKEIQDHRSDARKILENELKTIPGVRRVKFVVERDRPIGTLEGYSVAAVAKGLYFRQDGIVDQSTGRFYVFVTSAPNKYRSEVDEVLEKLFGSMKPISR